MASNSRPTKTKRIKNCIKFLFAAYLFTEKTQDPNEIADILNVPVTCIESYMSQPEWREALEFWNPIDRVATAKVGDLNMARRIWEYLLIDRPDISLDDLSVETLSTEIDTDLVQRFGIESELRPLGQGAVSND